MDTTDNLPEDRKTRISFGTVLLYVLVEGVFLGYLLAFGAWWFVCPKGFPYYLPRFWTNSVIPPVVILLLTAGLLGVIGKGTHLLKITLSMLTAATIAAVVISKLLYPVSMRAFFLVPACVWVVFLLVLSWRVFCLPTQQSRGGRWLLLVSILFSVAVGAFLPWSQRSWLPVTRPINEPLPQKEFTQWNIPREPVRLSDHAVLNAKETALHFTSGDTQLDVFPMLRFISRSPDRCWTLFARRADRIGPRRELTGYCKDDNCIALRYSDDDQSILEVEAFDYTDSVHITSYTSINEPIYSHLNSFTQMTFRGKEQLYVSFSPFGNERFEIMPYDYPFGRPAKFAYKGFKEDFYVVQASNAEKGPFRDLVECKLLEDNPLTITLYEGNTAVFKITLDDWAKQASRHYSPTAGWGVPVNAIAFNLVNENPPTAFIHITLGDSSVGRGFDSVGHTPGIYRNRMIVERLAE